MNLMLAVLLAVAMASGPRQTTDRPTIQPTPVQPASGPMIDWDAPIGPHPIKRL